MTQNNFLSNLLKGTLSLTKTVNVNEVSGGLERKNSILIQGDAGKLAALTPAELFAMPEVRDAIASVFLLGAYNEPVSHWNGTYGWRHLGDWGAGNNAILVHRALVADRAQTAYDAAGNLVVPGVIQSQLASNPGFQFHKPGVFGANLLLDDTNWLSTKGWSSGDGFASLRVGNLQVNGGIFFSDGSVQTTAAVGGLDVAAVDAKIAAAMAQIDARIATAINAAIAAAMVQVDQRIAAAINAAMAQVDAKIAAAAAAILQQVDAKIAAALSNSPSPSPSPIPSPSPVVSIGNILGPPELVNFQVLQPNQGAEDPIARIHLRLKPTSTWREWLAVPGNTLEYQVLMTSDYNGNAPSPYNASTVFNFTAPHADLFDENGNPRSDHVADRAFKWQATFYTAYIFARGNGQITPTSSKGFRSN